MHYQTLRSVASNGIATITLDRPDVKNALNTQMRAELTHAILQAGRSARVVVLTGNGDAFCSGQDLGDAKNLAHTDLERILRDEYEPMLRAISDCPVPVIAAVNGAAAGAGASLALACDVVVAAERAIFMQAFTKIGLMPDAGATYALPRQMGMAKAMGAALFADRITARQASDWGMIWEALPDEEFAEGWKARAQHLADGPSIAYANIKQAIRQSWGNSYEQQLTAEAQLQGMCGNTRDYKEGVLAFSEKRKPSFEGR